MPRAAKKKSSTKKKSVKKAKTLSKEIGPESYFLLIDGSALKGVEDLMESFDRMSEDVFRYHVNEFKNDFATWLREVFDEKDLAEQLKLANTLEQAHIALLKHVIARLKEF